jgi:hypothetical protein
MWENTSNLQFFKGKNYKAEFLTSSIFNFF